jgi:leucine dehydrogenase
MSSTVSLIDLSPLEFIRFLRSEDISRFYFVYDPDEKKVVSSHPRLQPLADFFQFDKRDFMEHEGMFFQVTREHDTLQGAFVHRTCRGQAAGGVRYWHYDTVEAFMRDGMRLGKGMTRKNALAGLWWGGGKGVMARNPDIDSDDPDIRASVYTEYGEFVSSIRGCYVTAEDVGTCVKDMERVFSRTRFTTCIPESWGGSGNPSEPTARGVVSGMEAALDYLGMGGLSGKRVAVQGMGNVGGPLIEFLFNKDVARVIACDINPKFVEKAWDQFRNEQLDARIVERDDISIFSEPVDIFSPNATGAVLNPTSIPRLKARIICGAANNQLEDAQRDDQALMDRNILYVPDFLTNRMGIVNAANEQYGYVNDDPLFERHLTRDWTHSIWQTTLRVLNESREKNEPTAKIAMRMADVLSEEKHPIFGHRGRLIIKSLVEDAWHELPR